MPAKRKPQEQIEFYWPLLIVAFAGAALFVFWQNKTLSDDYAAYFSGISSIPTREHTVDRARVVVDFGNGTKRAFEGEITENMTALLALQAAGNAGDFTVTTDGENRIVAIAGIRTDGARRWQAFVNNEPPDDLASRTEVRPGDEILFAYQ